uniref:Alpha/beta hydrolase fold-3 domain-containing protein n=1 Tax=Catagonus wagneri TaxID=51154 RepID=A0A8C3YMV8_9CETA
LTRLKILWLSDIKVLIAYYIYEPLPDNVEEPWKIMLFNAFFKMPSHMALFAEMLGLNHFVEFLMFLSSFQDVPPTSDENVTVKTTTFNNIPVHIHVPQWKPKSLRRSLFFIHGGGWCLGIFFSFILAFITNDLLSRQTADRLDAVYHFPVQFEDVHTALKWFLHPKVLKSYGVDPGRTGISGDSAGGNLAAAVTQQLLKDPNVKIKLKVQSLINPSLMVRLWSEYFTTDRSFEKAMLSNQHIPLESIHPFRFVNWSSLLPEKFNKGHINKTPTHGSSELGKKYPGFLDVKASPLLANDSKFRDLPLTYVITCQYDVLRDDGLTYVPRLQNSAVWVVHNHIEGAFHGTVSFLFLVIKQPVSLGWLHENLQ